MSDDIDRDIGGTVFERFFTGEFKAAEVAPNTLFLTADFVNVVAFETAAGLVLIDTGQVNHGERVHAEIRKQTDAPLHTVVFTHGHLDHAFGLAPWLAEAEGRRRPRVIAHRNVVERFRTYQRTAPLNRTINRVQFGIQTEIWWPSQAGDFFWPDTLYDDRLSIRVGGERFELFHAKGETDDATWVWAPERGIAASGDLWEWILPNCGNPQKVQRYPEEWADALERMASVGPELVLPGHGRPVEGAERIRTLFLDTAEALRSIVDQALAGLNAGLAHEAIAASVTLPEHLRGKAYLDPLYDRPEFIARNVIRRYGGWWGGLPSEVLPAPAADRAAEVVALAGGVKAVVDRARELAGSGDLALACHLAEWAALGAPDDRAAHECVIEVFGARLEQEQALMARGIFGHAVRQSQHALAQLPPG